MTGTSVLSSMIGFESTALYRLIVSFALFGFGLSALFAVASLYVRAKVEDQLVVSALQHDVDQAVAVVRNFATRRYGLQMAAPIRPRRILGERSLSRK